MRLNFFGMHVCVGVSKSREQLENKHTTSDSGILEDSPLNIMRVVAFKLLDLVLALMSTPTYVVAYRAP